jgi:hypothetical protein
MKKLYRKVCIFRLEGGVEVPVFESEPMQYLDACQEARSRKNTRLARRFFKHSLRWFALTPCI